HVGFGEQGGAGAAHELAQRRRQLQPVAVLEGQHQRPAFIVVAQGRTRPGKGRLVARAQGAERAWTEIEIEGQAAAVATGRADEADLVPAWGAQRALVAHRLVASEAA